MLCTQVIFFEKNAKKFAYMKKKLYLCTEFQNTIGAPQKGSL